MCAPIRERKQVGKLPRDWHIANLNKHGFSHYGELRINAANPVLREARTSVRFPVPAAAPAPVA